jgi:regulator of sigma E protease
MPKRVGTHVRRWSLSDLLDSPSLLVTILAFLLLLAPLIVVHELGHYLVGRWFGVKADAFSIGFGKELIGRTDRRGTRWKVSAIPLGGYVQFAGDWNELSMPGGALDKIPPHERAGIFHFKPLWQRTLIVLAGPVTNLLFAIAIFATFNMVYGRVVAEPKVVDFFDNSPAQAAGIKIGDRITAVDGERVSTIMDIPRRVAPYPEQTVSIGFLRDGRTYVLPVKLERHKVEDQFGNKSEVGDLGINFAQPVVGKVLRGMPAEVAGLRPDDRIVAIDGHEVKSFDGIAELILPNPGKTVLVSVVREDGARVIPVNVASVIRQGQDGKNERVGQIGIAASVGEIVQVGPVEAVTLGMRQCLGIMRMMVTGIGQILVGERSVKELGGPIKIAQYSGQQFALGWEDFVSFAALISINLAFINLLPIPALDGGHLAFYAAEAVRRKPLGHRSQEWAFRMGLAFVLALMLFVTINDLVSLPLFGR